MLTIAILGGGLWLAAAWTLGSFARRRTAGGEMKPIASRAEATADELLRVAMGLRISERLRFYLAQSGGFRSAAVVIHLSAAFFFIALGVASQALPQPVQGAALAPALAAAALPWLYVSRKRKRRLRKFEVQFPDSLEFASRGLRAGYGLRAAIEMVAHGFGEPLGGEFRRVFEDLREGLPVETAVNGLAARVPVTDVEFFVSAVLVHERTGGSLGEVLRNLAGVLRTRQRLRARARRMTIHGRTTGTIVSMIPLAAGGLMYFVSPDHVLFFVNDATGRLMLGSVAALQALGYLLVRRTVVVK